MTIDPFHPTSAYSRSKDVATRSRHDDLQELILDKGALEEQHVEDKRELEKLNAELIRLTTLRDQQQQRASHTKARLQNRIREIATLELQETDNG